MTRRSLVALLAASLALPACGPPHVAPFTPRKRLYEPGSYAQKDPKSKAATGSLFSDAAPGFLEDTRALRVGDVVVVRIDEAADAQGDSTTNLSKESSASAGADSLLGLVTALKKADPDVDLSKMIEYANKSGFAGQGNTRRKGELSARIAVRVARELPNGDLFLEGTKVILINNEEYHLYVSGVVRPSDIGEDNVVESSRLADAQVEFTGRGDIADQQRKGWLARVLDTLNPL